MMVQRRSTVTGAVLTLAAMLVLHAPAHAYSIPLTIEDRVRFETAIERVYWEHRLWPEENKTAKPTLASVLPEAAIRARVEDELKKSSALEVYWRQPVTTDQLQAEVDRMSRETRQPEVLGDLCSALDHDGYLIAECLARPMLVDRRIHELYASDPRFHGAQKQEIESELKTVNSAAAMRGLSGSYREILLRRQAPGSIPEQQGGTQVLALSTAEWNELTERMDQQFGGLPTQRVGALQEDADRFFVSAILDRDDESLRLATVEWGKTPFDAWWNDARLGLSANASATPTALAGKQSPSPANPDDTWSSTSTTNAPVGRYSHTAVWTGTEMIVWGGFDAASAFLNSGGRYNPATNSWAAGGTATFNAPSPRANHRAIWTGTEMVVWGGYDFTQLNTGGRYNPTTNTWATGGTSLTGAPVGRSDHSAVWTGSEMLVWGGIDGVAPYTTTGGRYNPTTNSWAAGGTSTTNAPSGRTLHASVWTGSELIVWGGYDGAHLVNTGGRYNPSTNSWAVGGTSTSNAPTVRYEEGAVWTGTQMIVWGGFDGSNYFNTGGRYDPATNVWTAGGTSTANAPSARRVSGSVWTGTEMIVWGGYDGVQVVNTGSRYSPATNSWRVMSAANAPGARTAHSGIWTGGDLIVWSGIPSDNTGGVYGASGGSTDVEGGNTNSRVAQLELATPSPNPSTGVVTMSYHLATSQDLRLTVHDVSGREVAELHEGESEAGWHSISWDGNGSAGHRAPAGVYYVRATGEGLAAVKQIVLLK